MIRGADISVRLDIMEYSGPLQLIPDDPCRRCLRPSAFRVATFWMLFGFCAATNLSVAAIVLIRDSSLSAGSAKPGVLQVVQNPKELSLPAEVPLGEFLVKEGDLVIAGAPVVAFDTLGLQVRMAQIRNKLMADVALRDCLLESDHKHNQMKKVLPENGPELNADGQAAILAAIKDCRADHDSAQQDLALVHLARNAVAAEMAIVLREIETLTATDPEKGQRLQRARAFSAYFLTRNKLAIKDAALTIEAQRVATRALQQRLSRVRELAHRIVSARQQLAILAAHLETPFLKAPEAGRVQYVRSVRQGTSSPQPIALIELAPISQEPGQVKLTLPQSTLLELNADKPISIEVKALGGEVLRLTGTLVPAEPSLTGTSLAEATGYEIAPSSDDADEGLGSEVFVALDAESWGLLNSANGASQLTRRGIAAEVVLSNEAQTLAAKLGAIWQKHAPSGIANLPGLL